MIGKGEAEEGPKKGAGGQIIRGSTELRLSAVGREKIADLNKKVVSRGCFWKIYYSSQMRAAETAHILTQNCSSIQFMRPCPELESWHLGGYEGQLVAKVLPQIQDMVARRPWVVPPGMGEGSTAPGESFNTFKTRVLGRFRQIMEEWENHPTKRIAVVTHFHDIQLIHSWLSEYKGQPGPEDDFYDPKIYNQEVGEPGEVIRIWKGGKTWFFDRINVEKMPALLPGIYIVRHGDTNWN